MSKSKYKRGKQIRSMCDFEHSKALWYKVLFGNSERTKHRSFLISWQYHTLELFISAGRVFEAYLFDDAVTDNKNEDFAEKRENENKCYWCENLENGDKLTFVRDWDGGTYNEIIYDIQFCPVCGKALKGGEQE